MTQLPDPAAALEASDGSLAFDEALEKLQFANPLFAQLVKVRYFVGLANRQAARRIGIAPRTAEND